MSTTSTSLQPIPAASAVLQPSQRPPSHPPVVAQPQPDPAASTEASNSNTEPTQATPAVQEQAPVSAAPAIPFRGWSLANVVWKNAVSLIAVIGFATAIYYALRGDATGTKGLYYTIKSWLLSAWTAEKDYCEFERTYKNDTTCDPGPPPVMGDVYKRWQEVSVTSESVSTWTRLLLGSCLVYNALTATRFRTHWLTHMFIMSGVCWITYFPVRSKIHTEWVWCTVPGAAVDIPNAWWSVICIVYNAFPGVIPGLVLIPSIGAIFTFILRTPPYTDEEDGLREDIAIINWPPFTAYEKRVMWWSALLVFPAMLNWDVVRYLRSLGSPIFRLTNLDKYFPNDEDSPSDPIIYRRDTWEIIGITPMNRTDYGVRRRRWFS